MKDRQFIKNRQFIKDRQYRNFLLFWFSQSVSQLGSSMTSFALIIWSYGRTGSAMSVSLMTFCTWLPYIAASVIAGPVVDRCSKKAIMLAADLMAAACSLGVVVLAASGNLQIGVIYLINVITGFMNAFQSPAETVAVGLLVPKERYGQASGLNSFTSSLLGAAAPMMAASLSSFAGLGGVIAFDLATFLFAFFILLFHIRIPEEGRHADAQRGEKRQPITADGRAMKRKADGGWKESLDFLREHNQLLYLIASLALMNFFSRLTYENILSPMILARSGQSQMALGVVSAVLGAGGMAGGLIVSFGRLPNDSVRVIFAAAGISFLFGDFLMGAGQNVLMWSGAALAASMPIPFITAAQNVILYRTIPQRLQGRIFSIRNAVQYGTIPLGILLGGYLADYVFEPMMNGNGRFVSFLIRIVGEGKGSGMAVMFLTTGILGSLTSLICYKKMKRNS